MECFVTFLLSALCILGGLYFVYNAGRDTYHCGYLDYPTLVIGVFVAMLGCVGLIGIGLVLGQAAGAENAVKKLGLEVVTPNTEKYVVKKDGTTITLENLVSR